MMRTPYSYGVILAKGEDGRYMAYFPDLPEALTDGADEAEALTEAADCLSEALASRIVDHEEIPIPSATGPDMHPVSPEPTIALKAALYCAMREAGITIDGLARRLGID